MATLNVTAQTKNAQLGECKGFLHIVSSLSVLSGSIMNDAEEGESYEMLLRHLKVLHDNIECIAHKAEEIESSIGD